MEERGRFCRFGEAELRRRVDGLWRNRVEIRPFLPTGIPPRILVLRIFGTVPSPIACTTHPASYVRFVWMTKCPYE